MDKFDLFVFSIFTENKSNSSIGFFGESRARQSAFRYYLTFSVQPLFWFRSNIKTETQIGRDFRPVWGIFSILKVPFKPDLLPNIQDFQKQKNVRKLKKNLKKKSFSFRKIKFGYNTVTDIGPWFRFLIPKPNFRPTLSYSQPRCIVEDDY